MKGIIALMILFTTINPIKIYKYGDEVFLHFNHKIEFNNNSAKLKASAKKELDIVAANLKERPKLQIEVGAHTDIETKRATAMELTNERANNIKDYLVSQGVNSENITAVGYGFDEPLIECVDIFNCTPEENKKNRRIEIKLINLREIGAYEMVNY